MDDERSLTPRHGRRMGPQAHRGAGCPRDGRAAAAATAPGPAARSGARRRGGPGARASHRRAGVGQEGVRHRPPRCPRSDRPWPTTSSSARAPRTASWAPSPTASSRAPRHDGGLPPRPRGRGQLALGAHRLRLGHRPRHERARSATSTSSRSSGPTRRSLLLHVRRERPRSLCRHPTGTGSWYHRGMGVPDRRQPSIRPSMDRVAPVRDSGGCER